jgi:hypothetical protein
MNHVKDFLATVDDLISGLLLRQEMILEAAGAQESDIRTAINTSRNELRAWAQRAMAEAQKAVSAGGSVVYRPVFDAPAVREERVLCEDGQSTLVYVYRGEELVGTRHEEPRADDEAA